MPKIPGMIPEKFSTKKGLRPAMRFASRKPSDLFRALEPGYFRSFSAQS
jgi:hypothetical protein